MEQSHRDNEMLALIAGPAFTVEQGTVTCANQQAVRYGVTVGTAVEAYLAESLGAYTELESGTLYLTLQIDGCALGAAVNRLEGRDVFLLDPPQCQPELQAVALAARELREPLSNILIAADKLLPLADPQDPAAQRQQELLNRNLHRMLRLVGNMSDAARYNSQPASRQELQNVAALVEEIFGKAATLAEAAGITLRFEGLQESVLSMTDREKLERAIYNLLSNAMKFTAAGGEISGALTRHGNRLHLRIRDNGSGIPDEVYGSLFSRHLRGPHLEDSRYGIGLGMVLVRSAAAAHGGTVLVQRLPEGGTCVTLTLAIRKHADGNVTSPILLPDYAGGFDHGLTELADVLPPEVYQL